MQEKVPRDTANRVAQILESLPERTAKMTMARIAVLPDRRRTTLQEVGDKFGLTRERVRQLTSEVRESLLAVLPNDAVDIFTKNIGDAATAETSIRLLSEVAGPDGNADAVTLASGLIFEESKLSVNKGWVLNEKAEQLIADIKKLVKESEPTPRGLISQRQIDKLAKSRDLQIEDLEVFVQDQLEWTRFEDLWLPQPSDNRRVLAALWCIGQPATKEEIAERSGLPLTRRVTAALGNLKVFCRTTMSKWALASWVEEPYEGVANEIKRAIRSAGGRASMAELLEELPRRFGTTENTVRTYAGTAIFSVEDGYVRETTEAERAAFNPGPPRDVDEHIQLDDGRWGETVQLNGSNFRGYSLDVSNRIAFANGVKPQTDTVVTLVGTDHKVSLIWRLNNTSPTVDVGRVTEGLQTLGFRTGDWILVIPEPDSVEIRPFNR